MNFFTFYEPAPYRPQWARLRWEFVSNVPVTQTIDIIIENVYNHLDQPALQIIEEILKKLLLICTTKKSFRHVNRELYI